MVKTRVKICCISSVNEALLAIKYGADALGLVGKMPSGPGVIDDALIQQIAKAAPPPVSTFLLTSETSADAIIEHYKKVNTTTIQIVDALPLDDYKKIRAAFPHVKLVQVIHVMDQNSVIEAIEAAQFADVILLDSGNPSLAIKELGGTGRRHDWTLSKQIRESINIPLFLAGGLNKDNVKDAIELVQPFGIDLCSSVRTNGNLDEEKLEALFKAIEA